VPLPHSTVVFAGQVIAGGVVSRIVIICTHVATLRHASYAVQTRVTTRPEPQVLVEMSLKLMPATPQLSVADAVPVLVGFKFAGNSKVTFDGQTITGTDVSLTRIVIEAVAELPQASVARHERMIVKRLPQV
jgi:hypothetical protein